MVCVAARYIGGGGDSSALPAAVCWAVGDHWAPDADSVHSDRNLFKRPEIQGFAQAIGPTKSRRNSMD